MASKNVTVCWRKCLSEEFKSNGVAYQMSGFPAILRTHHFVDSHCDVSLGRSGNPLSRWRDAGFYCAFPIHKNSSEKTADNSVDEGCHFKNREEFNFSSGKYKWIKPCFGFDQWKANKDKRNNIIVISLILVCCFHKIRNWVSVNSDWGPQNNYSIFKFERWFISERKKHHPKILI